MVAEFLAYLHKIEGSALSSIININSVAQKLEVSVAEGWSEYDQLLWKSLDREKCTFESLEPKLRKVRPHIIEYIGYIKGFVNETPIGQAMGRAAATLEAREKIRVHVPVSEKRAASVAVSAVTGVVVVERKEVEKVAPKKRK